MRLRTIKLAGFKSFVDPAHLPVSGNLMGIVGPNGCGKSNIIDAVIWVMGESSARHLRGETLTDVIFNGSGSRQPVGQAQVELVFDNTEGRIDGRYAAYNEISVRRLLNREGVSTYYLNGVRCRRRDIQDIFLGTGLGPRSYSIIEQGVISRLIEARPEELRVFLEEAAGISKFRERRRETENRIRRTQENIERLRDIRLELEQQLERLQRQARAARRFKELKAEERLLKAQILALDWRELASAERQKAAFVGARENDLEQSLAALRQTEAALETQRAAQRAAKEAANEAQHDFYQISGDIAQLEQRLSDLRARCEGMQLELEAAQRARDELQDLQVEDEQLLQGLRDALTALEPSLGDAKSSSAEAQRALEATEQAMQDWQGEWEALNLERAGMDKQLEVTQIQLESSKARSRDFEQRRDALQDETEAIDRPALKARLAQSKQAYKAHAAGLEQHRAEHSRILAQLQQLRSRRAQLGAELTEARASYQDNENNIAAGKALQEAEQGEAQTTAGQWLVEQGLADAPRLMESITVDEGWEAAFEAAAGPILHYVCAARAINPAAASATLQQGRVGLLLGDAASPDYAPKPWPRLIDKTGGPDVLQGALNRVYLADDMEQAQAICQALDESEFVVTRDGICMNKHQLRIHRPATDGRGALARARELSRLQAGQDSLRKQITQLEQEQEQLDERLVAAEQQAEGLLVRVGEQQEQTALAASHHSDLSARLEQYDDRSRQLEAELQDLVKRRHDAQVEQDELEQSRQQLQASGQALDTRYARLQTQRDERRARHDEARVQWQDARNEAHEIALQLESDRARVTATEQTARRNEAQLAAAIVRIERLQTELLAQDEPMQALRQALELKLTEKLSATESLKSARDAEQGQDEQLRELTRQRAGCEQQTHDRRAVLEQARIEHQADKVRLQTIEEQLADEQQTAAALLEEMAQDADPAQWQARLDALNARIQRLGAINLAAIEEHERLAERNAYLDRQHDDLNQALETLEQAIRKIDKETRARFKQTFEQVNENLGEYFPLLFDGGHASLTLTGPDLLETGVTVMARPPGKKNSTIHLLSGGEKALAAVALVFSIFRLNPAPFCILDEVDAPLDDTNVGRFCGLIKKMSEEVQFILVTHNKLTMETARQLHGVTMQEAGVSRLVSVDIEEAVAMAATDAQ